ncbi:MAG TPA: agmatine deiminase family protein, partial [Bacteroidales bacterium]|nr:agmatine deiminase family protein [Bacteroidales bacterium]
MRYTLTLIFSILLLGGGYSQETQPFSNFQGRHHMKDPGELLRMNELGRGFIPSLAPVAPVRNVAEFNRMEGVLVAYDGGFGIPLALIAEMAQDCKVWTIVPSSSAQSTVTNLYNSNGISLTQNQFMLKPIDSYWTRDYGPWFIVDGNEQVGIVDFPYNRPRPNDDAIPAHVATAMGLNVYNMNLVHTGGNYMTDGMGVSASTTLVATENQGLSTAQIGQLVLDYLGVHTYYLNNDPLGQYIEHIDCWGKFLDVDKVLIAEVPSSDPRYPDYEAVASFYASHLSSYGTPYQVIRVYAPNGQPYTNSLILNEKVLVPIVSSAGALWNDTALARYQQAMPGYEVIGIAQSNAAPWQSTDALHCRAKGIADRGILDIRHMPLLGDLAPQSSYELSARVIPCSGYSPIPDSMYCCLRINGGAWDTLPLVADTARWWRLSLPGYAPGTQVEYYLHASDSSGRTETHPFIGEPDPHSFTVRYVVGEGEGSLPERTRLRIYPNPASDLSFVNFSSWSNGRVDIMVHAMDGRLVYEGSRAQVPEGK